MNRSWWWLFAAEAVSTVGSQMTVVALPLIAVLLLHANPLEMGALHACSLLPRLLLGPVVGLLIDKHSRRRVLLVTNSINGAVLMLIPIAYTMHLLSVGLLAAIVFAVAAIGNAEAIAVFSFMPEIVESSYLASANSRFASIKAVARIVGTASAGVLISVTAAPLVVAADAASFFIAALLIAPIPNIAHSEQTPDKRTGIGRMHDAFSFITQSTDVVLVAVTAIMMNLFISMFGALQSLFIIRDLGVTGSLFGAALMIGSAAGTLGAFVSNRISRALSMRVLLAVGVGVISIGLMGISFLMGPPITVAIGFGACSALTLLGNLLVNVALATQVQERAPATLIGAIAGTLTAFASATPPLGALGGGVLAHFIGLRPALLSASVGSVSILCCLLAYCASNAGRRPMPAR
jgi:MFS family permease